MTNPESPPPVVLTPSDVQFVGIRYQRDFTHANTLAQALDNVASGTVTCIPTADLSTLREKAAAFDALGAQYNALEARYNEASNKLAAARDALDKIARGAFLSMPKDVHDDINNDATRANPGLFNGALCRGYRAIAREALRAQEPNNVSG